MRLFVCRTAAVVLTGAALMLNSTPAWACTTCDPAVQAGLFDRHFVFRLLAISLPLLLGSLGVGMLTKAFMRRLEGKSFQQLKADEVVLAGVFLGLGLGGFLDGIVLHQMLQVHQMISNLMPPDTSVVAKNINMFWDGVFHLGAWILTAIGIVLLWKAARHTNVRYSTPALLGALLLGWGAFNILDSLANHYLLRFHNVIERSANPWVWNLAFALFGVGQVAIGWLVIRRDVKQGKKARLERGV